MVARFLVVVVQWCHLKQPVLAGVFNAAPVFLVLEIIHLQNNRQTFHEKNTAQQRNQQFLAHHQRDYGNQAPQGQASRVAHENRGRIRVVPQKPDARPHKRRAENDQLAEIGYVHDVEVTGKNGIARQVGKQAQREADNGRRAGGQPVNAIGDIGSVGNRRDDENSHQHIHHPSILVGNKREQLAVIQRIVLEKRNRGHQRLDVAVGCGGHIVVVNLAAVLAHHHMVVEVQDQAHNHTQPYLPHNLEPPLQAFLVLFEHLDVIIQKADQSEPYRADNQQDDVHIVEPCEEQHRQQDCTDDDEAAHGGCAFFLHLPLQTQVADGLADLQPPQVINEAFAINRPHRHGDDQGDAGAERQVAKYSGPRQAELPVQVFKQVIKHIPMVG